MPSKINHSVAEPLARMAISSLNSAKDRVLYLHAETGGNSELEHAVVAIKQALQAMEYWSIDTGVQIRETMHT